jgi:hypothetical protein
MFMSKTLKTRGLAFSFIIFLCFPFLNATAQNSKPISKIYLEGGLGGGNYKSYTADLGLKMILKNKWSMNLSYKYLEMDPKNLPSDYIPETGYLLFFPITNWITTEMQMVSLTAGKYFKLSRNVWSTTEGGLSYVKGEKINFQKVQQTSTNIIIAESISSNYKTVRENTSTVGVMMQADINWAFASFMGVGAGVFTNLNSIQSPIGFNIKLLVGNMGRERKRKS